MTYTPDARHGIIHSPKNSIFRYSGWPSVCRDEEGTLYAVASAFRCEHICPFGKTAMWVSRNGGKTWTPPIVINDDYLDDRDAGILYMGKGRMLVTWFSHPADVYLSGSYYQAIKNSAQPIEAAPVIGMMSTYPMIPRESARGGSFVRVSEDYGVTWSDPIQLPVSAPHGPTLLKDGTVLYLGKELYSSSLPAPEPEGLIAAYISKDGGYTWQRQGLCDKPSEFAWENFHEPHVIELDDGTLLGAIRAQSHKDIYHNFSVYLTDSADTGKTWSPWRALNVAGSPPHLLKHSSGAIICSFGRREPPFGEFAVVSYDGGKTFADEYAVDTRAGDGDLGYPASVELDNGDIMTVYYQKLPGDGKPSILYTVWSLKR